MYFTGFLPWMSVCHDRAQCCWKPELDVSCLCVLKYNPGHSLQFWGVVGGALLSFRFICGVPGECVPCVDLLETERENGFPGSYNYWQLPNVGAGNPGHPLKNQSLLLTPEPHLQSHEIPFNPFGLPKLSRQIQAPTVCKEYVTQETAEQLCLGTHWPVFRNSILDRLERHSVIRELRTFGEFERQ